MSQFVCAGLFNDPVSIAGANYVVGPYTLADGHYQLSSATAALCGYYPSTFSEQLKLVFVYEETGEGDETTFKMCNIPDSFVNK